MVLAMKANLWIMKSMVSEHIFGRTNEFIKASGNEIRCMGRVRSSGPMVGNILGYIFWRNIKRTMLMIRNTGKGSLNGAMGENMKEPG